MSDDNLPRNDLPRDRPARVEIEAPEMLADGFRPYERFHLTLTHPDGARDVHERDILRGGSVVGVVLLDPARNELVLLRQFRLPAHLATGRGEMVEIVAGGIEPGEDPRAAGLRECREEVGLVPRALTEVMRFLPTPGITDEYATLFLGLVDATRLPDKAGAAEEAEVTHPFAIGLDDALAALAQNRFANGYLIVALQWVALNRARLRELAETTDAV